MKTHTQRSANVQPPVWIPTMAKIENLQTNKLKYEVRGGAPAALQMLFLSDKVAY